MKVEKLRGTFRGDQCVFEGEKLIVINKNRPAETRAAVLARVIRNSDPDELFIKPAVRNELEKIWSRLDRFHAQDEQIEELS